MVNVRIVNQPQEMNQFTQNNIDYYTILGINPFLNSLHICLDDLKKINIYLSGQVQNYLHHIIWNQYFNNTILKQAYHFVTDNGYSDHSFLKINGATYRLSDCLRWNNINKYRGDIQKCKCFSVQGFMSDGTMKKINFQIGKLQNPQSFDIVFKYQTSKDNRLNNKKDRKKSGYSQSFSSTGKKRNYSTVEINNNTNTNFMSNQKTKSKRTENKKIQSDRKDRRFIYTDTSGSKSNLVKNSLKYGSNLKNSNKCHIESCFHYDKDDGQLPFSEQKTKTKIKKFVQKQQVIGQLLRQKEGKLKDYQKLYKNQEEKYSKRIFQQQNQHKMEMQQIKSQVEQVLSTYKKKNKQLSKQNECLNDLNVKLMNNLQKSDNRLKQVTNQLQKITKQKKQLNEQNNYNKTQFQRLREENIKNKELYVEEKKILSATLRDKQKKAHQYKKKYQQMIQNMKKLVNVGIPQSPQPLSYKQNNF